MILFCQLDYPEELGTGTGATIAHFGCAEVCVTSSLVNVFGRLTDPHVLNQDLIRTQGYVSNGSGAVDIINWDAVQRIYPGITVLFNLTYYNPPEGEGLPADMEKLDMQLEKGYSVIVGVSFNHSPKEPTPTHYVEIYKKNDNGTYQCRDPWFKDGDKNFDASYAVNGMSASECILQMISYTGVLPSNSDLVSALAAGSAEQVNKDVSNTPITVTIPADSVIIPKTDLQKLKDEAACYTQLSDSGYPNTTSIDNLKTMMQNQVDLAEEHASTLQKQHETDLKTIQDLKEEVLSANRDAEMASKAYTDHLAEKSTAIEHSVELGDQVQKLESDIKSLVAASGIPKQNTNTLFSMVKYFSSLREKAEKVIEPPDPEQKDTPGNFLLKTFGLKTILIVFSFISISSAALFFIAHVAAAIR